MNKNEKETTIFDLTNPWDRKILKVDEDFWDKVSCIFFNSTHLKIILKDVTTHTFLHYWFYENVQEPSQAYTEEDKKRLWKNEGCEYCFVKENKDFLNWFYEQAEERDLIAKQFDHCPTYYILIVGDKGRKL